MDETTHEVFDALRRENNRESCEVRSYRLSREMPDGGVERLTIHLLDSGGRVVDPGQRYQAEIEREDGRVHTGPAAVSPREAITLLPWSECD